MYSIISYVSKRFCCVFYCYSTPLLYYATTLFIIIDVVVFISQTIADQFLALFQIHSLTSK